MDLKKNSVQKNLEKTESDRSVDLLVRQLIMLTKKGNIKWRKLSLVSKRLISAEAGITILEAYEATDAPYKFAVFSCERLNSDEDEFLQFTPVEMVLFGFLDEEGWHVTDYEEYDLIETLGSIFRLFNIVKTSVGVKNEIGYAVENYIRNSKLKRATARS